MNIKPELKRLEAEIERVAAKRRTELRNPEPDPYDAFVDALDKEETLRSDLIELRNAVKRRNPKDSRIPGMNEIIREWD